jgi:hypothetical protein
MVMGRPQALVGRTIDIFYAYRERPDCGGKGHMHFWKGLDIFTLIGKDQTQIMRDRSKSGTCHHLCQSLMMLTSSHTAQFVKTSSYVLFPHFGFQKRKFTKHISFWSFPHVRPSHIIPTYDIYAFFSHRAWELHHNTQNIAPFGNPHNINHSHLHSASPLLHIWLSLVYK